MLGGIETWQAVQKGTYGKAAGIAMMTVGGVALGIAGTEVGGVMMAALGVASGATFALFGIGILLLVVGATILHLSDSEQQNWLEESLWGEDGARGPRAAALRLVEAGADAPEATQQNGVVAEAERDFQGYVEAFYDVDVKASYRRYTDGVATPFRGLVVRTSPRLLTGEAAMRVAFPELGFRGTTVFELESAVSDAEADFVFYDAEHEAEVRRFKGQGYFPRVSFAAVEGLGERLRAAGGAEGQRGTLAFYPFGEGSAKIEKTFTT